MPFLVGISVLTFWCFGGGAMLWLWAIMFAVAMAFPKTVRRREW